ncbi:MAG: hypothetical protein GY851_14180 [bacterium]|nr:hypothetical protein [bacterium]
MTLVLSSMSVPYAEESGGEKALDIGLRLELFVDNYLIEGLDGVELRLHEPRRMPLAENPLEGGYVTVIKDGDLYRAYYRDYVAGYEGPYDDGNPGEITCYAESGDGHEWTFPDLGLFDARSPQGGNAILANASPCSHNFSPFLDTRPGNARGTRFKALAGIHSGGGPIPFGSDDGIHWAKLHDTPVITSENFAFDSQNVSFWSETENCYVCYCRTWRTPHGKLRTISRTTSRDYVHWETPRALNPNEPDEHLYTSQTHPYFRAPHICVALPTRFMPSRGESTEVLFMTARGGAPYERSFLEAFIRPGLDPARWGNRANYAALNVVPTGPDEMSIYHAGSGHRYVLRTDGFVSVLAPYEGGELVTKPLVFRGNRLVLNVSTSGSGSVLVELQTPEGEPLPGYGAGECPPIVGDAIEHVVSWKSGTDVGALSGTPVRIRFVMKDSDLFSLRFVE